MVFRKKKIRFKVTSLTDAAYLGNVVDDFKKREKKLKDLNVSEIEVDNENIATITVEKGDIKWLEKSLKGAGFQIE